MPQIDHLNYIALTYACGLSSNSNNDHNPFGIYYVVLQTQKVFFKGIPIPIDWLVSQVIDLIFVQLEPGTLHSANS